MTYGDMDYVKQVVALLDCGHECFTGNFTRHLPGFTADAVFFCPVCRDYHQAAALYLR